MIEIRWVVPPNTWVPSVGWPKLQYRVHTPAIDASGALCPGPGWSDWMDVPTEVVPAPNVRSQATDADLSRQVACTDGLGLAPGKEQ